MGYDDGDCEIAADGVHVFVLDELVTTERGLINQVHRCACGAEVLDASAAQEAARRPPL